VCRGAAVLNAVLGAVLNAALSAVLGAVWCSTRWCRREHKAENSRAYTEHSRA
jgi:gamma-glutamyl-gamma-aminobutyrate hydrolase PuuD